MKPGYKTSEFWLSAVTMLASLSGAAAGVLPPKYAAIAMAISTVGYAIARAYTKGNAPLDD